MSLYSSYFEDFIKLFPSLNDYLQLQKYKKLQIYFENSISEDYVEKIRNFALKYKEILKKKKTLSIYDKILKYDGKIVGTELITKNFARVTYAPENY